MQIQFKKEQIVKDNPQSIIIDYGEYKLQCPKWIVKNNSFIADDKYTYWVFNLENIKRELFFNFVEKYGWPKIIHQFTLKILFLIKNLLKVTLFSVKIL